jgi:heterodisulfide reductase subunit C
MIRRIGNSGEKEFSQEIVQRSGQDLLRCLQCGKCSGSCPICTEEIGGPRRLIARILYGMKREALADPTWWYCVSCGTCATRCPVEINMYPVATVLCEMAAHESVRPSAPAIHRFEELFLKSVERHGRVRELQMVAEFNLRSLTPFKDMLTGLKLLRKGAISPAEMIQPGRKDPAVKRIFDRARAEAE